MSPRLGLFALALLALFALFTPAAGCGRAETDEEEAVSAGAQALAADAASFQISGLPASVSAGVPATFTVRAVTAEGDTSILYTGTVHFSASSPSTVLPADYTFAPEDAGVHTFSFTVLVAGNQVLTVTDTLVPGITGSASTTVTAAANSAITAPSTVTSGATGLSATTTSWSGATYTWTISNGTLTAGQGTRAATFTAGAPTSLTLGVIAVRNGSIRTGTRTVTVAPIPQTPTLTAATAVAPSSTGNTAWVTAVTSMKYTWTITRGTITSSGGTAGVTSGGINKITYTAQATGPVVLTVVEKNAANAASAPATVSIPVVANAPRTPTISSTSPVTEGDAGRTASVTARTGMSYVWTILGGTITSPGGASGVTASGKNTISYTAGPPGTIAFTCKETNGTYFSAPALKSVTSLLAPQTPVVTTLSPVPASTPDLTATVPARAGMTYAWSIAGGMITSSTSGVTSSGVNTVTFTSGGPGTLTLSVTESNAAGATSAPGSAQVTVSLPVVPPVTPVILTSSPISAGTTSSASVVARSGLLYAWTLSAGTITSPGGASGVTSGGVNAILFHVGSPGPVTIECVEITGAGVSAPGVATIDVTEPPPATGEIYFVAHQDDDLLFMNPDIERSILAGRPTRTVFVTAGDPGTCTECWQARENGIWNAYAAMANAAKDWTCTPTSFGGKTVSLCVLNTAPHVSVVFMRLPDGGLSSLWSTEVGPPFWVTPVTSLTSVDNAYSVTRDEVITLIYDLIADFHPAVVGTMDGSLAYGDDHYDHIASGLWGLDSTLRITHPLTYRLYRGYNIYGNWFNIPSPEPENLSPAEYAEKVRIMEAYGGGFPVDSDFDHWCHRRYAVSSVIAGTGPLVSASGKCLDTQGGGSQEGAPIEVRTCDGGSGQIWTISPDGKVMRATGRCLARSGDAAVLTDCAVDPAHQLKLFHNGQLRGASGACLTIGWDEAQVGFAMCDADRTTDKYVPLPSQRFTQVFGASSAWSEPPDFSNADVGGARSYYATFRLGHMDADSRADAFVRRAAGASVALNDDSGFDTLGGATGAFGDATGWLPEPYGATVQVGDVSGDGIADVCGRNASGIACAITGPTGALGAESQWSTDFADATFGGAAYYPSIRLGDIDGDGYADVCGRSSAGVVCARNTHAGAFGAAEPWTLNDFTDAGGFGAPSSAGTLRLGDVNGDGKADVCARGSAGVRCAISNGSSAFTDAHLWSFRGEWSDAEGWGASADRYGSLDLGDVNGDGKADLCGRAPTGLTCAFSDGDAFEGAAPVQPFEYTDSLGWASEPYGATLRLADLSGDHRADVCGRSPEGLLCAIAP